jgi:hypothetical protein
LAPIVTAAKAIARELRRFFTEASWRPACSYFAGHLGPNKARRWLVCRGAQP